MRKLYIDFDGVVINTNQMIDAAIADSHIDKEDKEKLSSFLIKLDYKKILEKASAINDNVKHIGTLKDSKKFDVKILTHVLTMEEAEAKINFIKRYYNDIEVLVVPKSIAKSQLVDPKGNILVDDYAANLRKWKEDGGIGVRFSLKENGKGFTAISHLDQLIDLFD